MAKLLPLCAVLGLLAAPEPPVTFLSPTQCDGEHGVYRWTVKTTLAQQGATSTAATPSAMLHWAPLDLYRPAVGVHDCTRADRELTVYAVTGWARACHIEKGP